MDSRSRRSGLESLALFLLLFAFWVALSGRYELQPLVIGAICSALVTAITHDRLIGVGRFDPEFGVSLRRISPVRTIRYILWLLWEIILANLQVAQVVLRPGIAPNPRLLRFRVGFENRLPQVVLAHSITLTPGTVTIDLDQNGEYLVHVLVPRFADPLLKGRTQNGIAGAFGEEPEPPPAVEWIDSILDTGAVVGRDAPP